MIPKSKYTHTHAYKEMSHDKLFESTLPSCDLR